MSGVTRREPRAVRARVARACSLFLVCLAPFGCKKNEPDPIDAVRPSPSGSATTPDRVGPGVLIEGEQVLWGFRVPKKMTSVRVFRESASLEGEVSLAHLEEYVRERVTVRHVEVTPEKSVFPEARIKGGDPNRTYRFELVPEGRKTRLRIQDTTRPPATPGLTPEQRWNKVGLTPQGKPIPGKLE